ncbi:MAG: sugar phosphate isomerase/epimerase family protein [Micrococcaceae bacterium]
MSTSTMDSNATTANRLQLDVACQSAAFATDPFSEAFSSALPQLHESGYRRVVLGPIDHSHRGIADLGRRIHDAGLSPITMAIQTPEANVASPESAVRRRGYDLLRRFIDMSVRMGADQLNGVPYGVHGEVSEKPDEATMRRTAELVGDAAEEAAAARILMTFEVVNRYETSIINTAAQAVQFVEYSGSKRLKIHLDTFHMAMEESDLFGALTYALPHLGYLEFGQSSRGCLSQGSMELTTILRHVQSLGYSGRFGVEGFSRATMEEAVADQLRIWDTTFSTGAEFMRDAAELFR